MGVVWAGTSGALSARRIRNTLVHSVPSRTRRGVGFIIFPNIENDTIVRRETGQRKEVTGATRRSGLRRGSLSVNNDSPCPECGFDPHAGKRWSHRLFGTNWRPSNGLIARTANGCDKSCPVRSAVDGQSWREKDSPPTADPPVVENLRSFTEK